MNIMKTIKLPTTLSRLTGIIGLTLFSFASAGVQADESIVKIGALVSGQVTQIYVKAGDKVSKGAKLLTLDGSRYQAKLKMLQSQLQMAKLEKQDARIELDQALDLFDRTVTSKRTLDASQLRFDRAQAAYDKANAEVQVHRAWAKYVYVKAPVSGVIDKVHTPLGSTVFKENTPMIEIKTK